MSDEASHENGICSTFNTVGRRARVHLLGQSHHETPSVRVYIERRDPETEVIDDEAAADRRWRLEADMCWAGYSHNTPTLRTEVELLLTLYWKIESTPIAHPDIPR